MANADASQTTFPGAIRLFRFRGIDVFLHWSWAIIALIALRTRSEIYESPFWGGAEYLTLFAIVLLHEFGHALACRSVGGQANRILLWPLGGVAYVSPPRRPGAVLWSIAAGPLVNVALVPFTFGAAAVCHFYWADAPNDVLQYLEMVALINIVLLVFNMMPIYPLDGGQILQSILWFFIGFARSLGVAASIGLVGAVGVIILAVTWGNPWLIVLAIFGVSNSWRGLQHARALTKLLRQPRHSYLACPACHEPPPVGIPWGCRCGEHFDPFATGGICPACGLLYAQIPCPFCNEVRPFDQWQTGDVIIARPIISRASPLDP